MITLNIWLAFYVLSLAFVVGMAAGMLCLIQINTQPDKRL